MIKLIIPYFYLQHTKWWLMVVSTIHQLLYSTNPEMLIKYSKNGVHIPICYLQCLWINHGFLPGGSVIHQWLFLIFFHKCPINHQFRILITIADTMYSRSVVGLYDGSFSALFLILWRQAKKAKTRYHSRELLSGPASKVEISLKEKSREIQDDERSKKEPGIIVNGEALEKGSHVGK